jgi:hypothetical protein
MRNEVRGAAFNLSNPGATAASLRITIEGLPGGMNPPSIAVHEVLFTDTKSGEPVAAAMPLARRDGDGYVVDLLPGLTRQIWLNFNSKTIPAGEYQGRVVLSGLAQPVPVRLKVYPLTFPDQPTLHLGGWDYTDREICYEATPVNRAALIRHLREHFVDTPWAQAAVLPLGKYDREGRMTEPPADQEFQEWIRRWPGARNYYVFAAVGESFGGFSMRSPAFQNAVAAWITWWVDWLGQRHIRPGQLGLLLVDEPFARAQDEVIIQYARVIRAAQPGVTIWEDPMWADPTKAAPEMFALSHVLCPNLPMWIEGGPSFARFYLRQQEAGKKLWYYSCSGPGKLLDPYSYHRMQQWFCWKYGAEGSAFWAFGDSNGASSWNEYGANIGAFTPLFLDGKSVTPGKHMEAIREGIEDYEYLHLLSERLKDLDRNGTGGQSREAARKLLASAPDQVIGCMTSSKLGFWKESKDRAVADRVRVQILDALAGLGLPEATQGR